MKSLLLLIAAVPLLAVAQASAQIAAPPAAALPESTPAASPAPATAITSGSNSPGTHAAAAGVPLPGQPSAGPALEKNLPLIPETAPGSGAAGGGPGHAHAGASPHQAMTFKTEDDIRMRIRMRIAQTRAQNDPALQAEWIAAHHAPTDPKHRALLTDYYNHLYDKMIKLDPGIAQRANLRRGTLLSRMNYTRLGEGDNSTDPFIPPPPVVSGPNPPPAAESSNSAQ